MKENVIRVLSRRRHEIHQRWEALLRLERVTTPLANPDALVHMIDWTLDRVFKELRGRRATRPGPAPSSVAAVRGSCECGHNPFLAHFLAGEQALLEALVTVQKEASSPDPVHRGTEVAELYVAINAVANREVESICALCTRRVQATIPRPQPVALAYT